jgi:hypothetical protein
MKFFKPPYANISNVICDINNGEKILLIDHLNGFDNNISNQILTNLNDNMQGRNKIWHVQILDNLVKSRYNNLDIEFDFQRQCQKLWVPFATYNQHPHIDYKNFICSFNGSDHVSRKLLVAILEKFGYFTTDYCSKNFVFTKDKLGGHITDYVGDQDNFYRKFFIANDSDIFFDKINSFGHVQYDHKRNIYNLEHKLTQSFLHIVSETMATSYYPFVTEKFLYSVVTRGLFLAYAQPGWHEHLEKYYGFKRYTKLFDYEFDSIQNPVDRLVELITMISKFSILSTSDWRDLYLLQQDEIEYNYNHYFSDDYLKHLKQYA